MVIAVAIVLMMEMAIYQIINMVSVRDRFVATARSVHVVGCVAGANVSARATGWIRAGHFQRVFFDNACAGLVMQVTVM